MIEKYFQRGIRYKWTKPGDATGGTRDGSLVDSRMDATPLVYDGMDDQLLNPTLYATALRGIGLNQIGAQVHYAWLDYAPGHTARLPVGPYDVLTGYMSGCIVTHWVDKGIRYTGRIGTIDGAHDIDREVKRTFSFAMPKTAKGFNPAGAWTPGEIAPLAHGPHDTLKLQLLRN